MSFDEIVTTYIREYRNRVRAEMQVFADQKSPSAAIRRAALCLRSDDKRHDHQRRIPRQVLEQAEARLQAISKKLATASDFNTLHKLVHSEIGSVRGVGDLTAYDIAHRIGCYFGKHPERVYLHAGTKAGARAFGIRSDSFDPAVLPNPFSRLTPAEIEDVLCIFADELHGGKRNGSSSGCPAPQKPQRHTRRVC
jgi:hypothetical protein